MQIFEEKTGRFVFETAAPLDLPCAVGGQAIDRTQVCIHSTSWFHLTWIVLSPQYPAWNRVLLSPIRLHSRPSPDQDTRAGEPMTHSAYAFCHGERGAVGIAWIPMPFAVAASAATALSRS